MTNLHEGLARELNKHLDRSKRELPKLVPARTENRKKIRECVDSCHDNIRIILADFMTEWETILSPEA